MIYEIRAEQFKQFQSNLTVLGRFLDDCHGRHLGYQNSESQIFPDTPQPAIFCQIWNRSLEMSFEEFQDGYWISEPNDLAFLNLNDAQIILGLILNRVEELWMAPLTTTVSVHSNKCFWRGLLNDIETMAAILDNGIWLILTIVNILFALIFLSFSLTLKAPITTAADNKFCDIFANFQKNNKVWYFMRIVCQQTILIKYHALFVIFEEAAKFEIVVCCKL